MAPAGNRSPVENRSAGGESGERGDGLEGSGINTAKSNEELAHSRVRL